MREAKLRFTTRRLLPARLALALPAVLLSACQVLQTPVAPAPRLNITPSADQSAPTPAANPPGASTTYTVKRDTLKQTLAMQGRVAPTRSAQLTLHGGGTVTEVTAKVGQDVKQGDTLAEFAADDQSLQAARTQATLAELAYEQEQTKLDQLQAGTPTETLDQARAIVARDRAAIAQLNQQAQMAQDAADKAQKSAGVAKSAADRKVQLAQVALQSAQDSLAAAQEAATEADIQTRNAQAKAQAEVVKTQADAAAAVVSAKLAVVQARRGVTSANLKLSQAKMSWAITRASQEIETQQFKVGQDTDAVKDAKSAAQKAQSGTAAQSAAADNAVASAQRALQADQLALKHDQTNLDTSHTVDDAAVQQATLDLQTAQDTLTQAQDAVQKAEQRVQDLANQPAAAADTPTTSGGVSQLTPAAAQAAIKQAQHAVDTATLNLQDAQATADQAGDTASAPANVPPAPDQSALDAAQAQLDADQAHLAGLQTATSQADVAREQARVNLLHDQATTAAGAAQPVVSLKAPFDGTVTDVGIAPGQTVSPGATATSIGTVGATLAGQNTQGEPVAIRIVAAGNTAIVADASETDVAQLTPGQSVNVSFPGLTGQSITATISQIAATPTTKDSNVTYPVQIDLPSAPPNLKMGMTAQVSLTDSDATALVAPRAAVQTVGGQSSVTRLDPNGQTENVQVQLGKSGGGNVELLGGVQEGDKLLMPPAAPGLPLMAAQPPSTSQP
jgi:multidrug efflux pump subunit AcrA (membrane-fusion protein)